MQIRNVQIAGAAGAIHRGAGVAIAGIATVGCLAARPDAARLFRCAGEAEDVPFAIVVAATKSARSDPLDLEPARRHLGYVPQDTSPDNSPHPVPESADA